MFVFAGLKIEFCVYNLNNCYSFMYVHVCIFMYVYSCIFMYVCIHSFMYSCYVFMHPILVRSIIVRWLSSNLLELANSLLFLLAVILDFGRHLGNE